MASLNRVNFSIAHIMRPYFSKLSQVVYALRHEAKA